MYEQLRARIASILRRPRMLKPQTERQVVRYLDEHGSTLANFLLCAAGALEEYELDVVFGPVFTPTLDERADVADLLFHWRPTAQEVGQLSRDLSKDLATTAVRLPDGSEAELTFHEVMAERYVRLLRLEHAPEPSVTAALRDALPAELWTITVAMLCERGMTPRHQAWFAGFVNHMASRRAVTRPLLETVADFIGRQGELGRDEVLAAGEVVRKATEGTAAYAASGHAYWSADVAQHHHYHGQGNIDQVRVARQRQELERVNAMVEDLRTFPGRIPGFA